MAVNVVGTTLTAFNTSSSTPITFTIPAGVTPCLAVVVYDAGIQTGSEAVTSITDTASNVYTRVGTTLFQGSIPTGITHGVFTGKIATSASAVTVTLNGITGYGAKSALMFFLQGVNYATPAFTTKTATSTTGVGSLVTPPASNGDLVVMTGAATGTGTSQSGASDTTNGTWGTVTSVFAVGGSINANLAVQAKTITSGTNVTQTGVMTTSGTVSYSTGFALVFQSNASSGTGAIGLNASVPGPKGALSLTATATDELKFPRTGSGSIGLVATADVIPVVTGTGLIDLVASATSALRYPSTASGTVSLTGTANGVPSLSGLGTVSLTGVLNSAKVNYASTGSGSLSLLGTVNGVASLTGNAVINLTLSGSGFKRDNFVGWGIPL
jgi:hypothetical protein